MTRHRCGAAAGVQGFTLIDIMIAMVVLGILAMTAIPSLQIRYTRDQLIEAMPLADLAKGPVVAARGAALPLPVDNAAAGLPAANKIVSNLVSSVAVEHGAIHVTFGNKANGFLKGKVLSLRPAVVVDAAIVPLVWVCGYAAPPGGMTVHGTNRSTVDTKYLPAHCRAG